MGGLRDGKGLGSPGCGLRGVGVGVGVGSLEGDGFKGRGSEWIGRGRE